MASVTVTLQKSDLLMVNARELLRPARIARTFFIVSTLVFAFVLFAKGLPQSPRSWLILAVGAVAGSVAAYLIAAALSTCTIAFVVSKAPGVLGDHYYSFHDDGLLEKTVANETLIKWGGAKAIHIQRDYFLLEIAPGMHHIFPRRAFNNEAEFQGFANLAGRLLSSRA